MIETENPDSNTVTTWAWFGRAFAGLLITVILATVVFRLPLQMARLSVGMRGGSDVLWPVVGLLLSGSAIAAVLTRPHLHPVVLGIPSVAVLLFEGLALWPSTRPAWLTLLTDPWLPTLGAVPFVVGGALSYATIRAVLQRGR
jgi:hypothetical protein